MVIEYLQLLSKLTEIILEDNQNVAFVGHKAILMNIINEFNRTIKTF